jgi:hypothetical protein
MLKNVKKTPKKPQFLFQKRLGQYQEYQFAVKLSFYLIFKLLIII